MRLSIHSPDELIAALPHLLGFKPQESLVFVPTGSELPTARLDLPTTPADREAAWASISDVFRRHATPGASLNIVCVTTDRELADQVVRDFTDRLDVLGIATTVRIWADDSRWCNLDTKDEGVQSDAARERIAALAALNGRAQPASSRDSLAASLVGDRDPVAHLLPQARQVASESTPRTEAQWAFGRLQQFHRDGVRLTDADASRLLVATESIPIRDALWDDMDRSNAAAHVALWTDITRRAPDDVRAAPASLLAFASWLSGHGALAWCALDQVPAGKPYTLATLVATAVQGGMHPRVWEAAKTPPEAHHTDPGLNLSPLRPGHHSGHTRPTHGI